MARTDPNTVQSVLRASSLLDCFADGRRDSTLTELAAATGLTTSTAYRLLRTLTQAGLLWREPHSERYLPGPALLRLARSVLDTGDVASSREVVESLAVRTGLPVSVAVRVGDGVETILGADGDGVALPDPRTLPRLPLHATALGKVLLAYAAPDLGAAGAEPGAAPGDGWGDDRGPGDGGNGAGLGVVSEAGPDRLPRFTAATIASRADLAVDLSRVLDRAYAVEDLEYTSDRRGVAVPVRGDDGRVVAALGVVGAADVLPLAAVRRTGLELAAAAGALGLPRSLVGRARAEEVTAAVPPPHVPR
ncbi:IclR family transcriptional regulator [Frankia canadensis]|uniref:IclR family transcriptional regulator n=1 Tax=Frankia canadensis TaxID=1836972 RepID=UPI0010554098|nr:IclR family transcriptional regulator [Frankia canadensis]